MQNGRAKLEKECFNITTERFFEPCILMFLSEKNSYGYDLKSKLEKNHNCNVNIGGLYRTLAKLKKNNYIEDKVVTGEKGPDKKVYKITSEGKKALKFWINGLEKQNKIINNLILKYKKHESNKSK